MPRALTIDQIDRVQSLNKQGFASSDICIETGLSRTTVWRILNGKQDIPREKPTPKAEISAIEMFLYKRGVA